MSKRKAKPAPNKPAPVDTERCQVEITRWEPFRIGAPALPQRCKGVATWILVEAKPGKDGHHGGMSVCDACRTKAPKEHIQVEIARGF